MTVNQISAIVITKNEAHNLGDCLSSIADLAHEIIVIDSNSQDETVSIAKKFGAIVVQPEDWQGFGVQKNRALSLATKTWILSVDADERISPQLAQEIKLLISDEITTEVFEIPRMSWYCDRFIMHSGWRPDYVLRLFKKSSAKFNDNVVHERVVHSKKVGRLKNSIIHYSYRNYEQVIDKMNAYSTASAFQMHKEGRDSNIWKALGHGLWTFIRTYIIHAGFLDGEQGLALAISNAEGSYYKHLKLALLSNQTSN